MKSPTRPPPKVLWVHNGLPHSAEIKYLADEGLQMFEAHGDDALDAATSIQPDIVLLDLDCDGELTAQLKGNVPTQHIPIIGLAELTKRDRLA